jgi:hypothetical protein
VSWTVVGSGFTRRVIRGSFLCGTVVWSGFGRGIDISWSLIDSRIRVSGTARRRSGLCHRKRDRQRDKNGKTLFHIYF